MTGIYTWCAIHHQHEHCDPDVGERRCFECWHVFEAGELDNELSCPLCHHDLY